MGLRANGDYFSNLRFAGDTALVSNSGDSMQSMSTDFDRQTTEIGLKINLHETKVTFNALARELPFAITNDTLAAVIEYTYIGRW